MLPRYLRKSFQRCVDALRRPRGRTAEKRRPLTRRPTLELLEDRVTPAAVAWDGGAGTLNWADAPNWSNDAVPTSADDVTISVFVSGTINLTGSRSVRTLNYTSTTGGLAILSGSSLSIEPVFANSTFGRNVDVLPGGTLNIGAAARVTLSPNVTLTNNGMMSVGTGAAVAFGAPLTSGTTQVVVGGVLSATGASFFANFLSAITELNVYGRLQAANCYFGVSKVYLDNASVLNATDLVGNTFDSTLQLPQGHVQHVGNNLRFKDVTILAGSVPAGQTLALNAIGTATTANLRYVFSGSFTVASGATLTVAPNVQVALPAGTTLTNNGGMSVGSGAAVAFGTPSSGGTVQLLVGNGGALSASNAAFYAQGGSGPNLLKVNSGGRLQATNCYFAVTSLTLESGSLNTFQFVTFATPLSIHSGASVSIASNDFSSASATVVAWGDSNATIDLRNNYWGTTVTANIEAKITHRPDAPVNTRPLVLFDPFLSTQPPKPSITGTKFSDLNGNGVRDAGEPAIAGVSIYLDANNNRIRDTGELSTNSDVAGNYVFTGLNPGIYVVREVVPAGFTQTFPLASSVTQTVSFEGTGEEAGITGAGATNFTFKGATFGDGVVILPGSPGLRASGSFAYNAAGAAGARVVLNRPIDSVRFFYVHGTGVASGFATALDARGNALGSVASRAATTQGDTANFVTLDFATPIAQILFSGGAIDDFAFSTQANDQAHVLELSPGQAAAGIDFGNRSPTNTFQVATTSTSRNGFTANFTAPLDVNVLNLYDAFGNLGPADVTLVGNTVGNVAGSLIVNPDGLGFNFVKTGGLLAPGIYTFTLRSAANGVKAAAGGLLDGNRDGTPGDNFAASFIVSAPPANEVVVGLPDFARGPSQAVNVPANGTGLPVTLSTGAGVESVLVEIRYDPALLTISGATLGPDAPTGSLVTGNFNAGVARITFSTPTALTAGQKTILRLTANVPANATYRSKHALTFSVVSVNAGTIPAAGNDAVHVAAYSGNATGSGGVYDPLDAQRVQRVEVGLDTGFAAFPVADPVVVADILQNGTVDGLDAVRILQETVGIDAPEIPALPSPLPTITGDPGPDPVVSLRANYLGRPGNVVPVSVDFARLTGDTSNYDFVSMALRVRYNPTMLGLTVDDIQPGTITRAAGWSFVANIVDINTTTKEILVSAARPTGVNPDSGTLAVFNFRVLEGVSGPTPLNLQATGTLLRNNAGQALVLSPIPTDGADAADGNLIVNQPPVPGLPPTPVPYPEDGGNVLVAPDLTLFDADNNPITGAVVTLLGFVAGQDRLGFTSQFGITGTYNDALCILTLTGTAPVAQYQTVLRSVYYANSSQNPNTGVRTVTIVVNDGIENSVEARRDINVIAINDAPVVTLNRVSFDYLENAGNVVVAPNLTVTDVDSATLTGAVVTLNGFVAGQDSLGFTSQFGITEAFDAGVLTLTGIATVAQYQIVLRSVYYTNSSDNPSTAARSVTIVVSDGIDTSAPAQSALIVIPVNDTPVVPPNPVPLNYTENDGNVVIDPNLTVLDVDSATLTGAVITLNGFVAGQDALGFTSQFGITEAFDAGVLTLTGTATVAQYQTVLRSVYYTNSSDNPSTAARSVTIVVSDGAGNSVPVERPVIVIPVNDAPILPPNPAPLNYTENAGNVAVDLGLTILDVDNTTLTGARVAITEGYVRGEDVLVFTNQNGITGTFDDATGVLTLTGTATVEQYQFALRSVFYINTRDNPSTATRKITCTVIDGTADSAAQMRTVNVIAVNDAPVNTVPGPLTGPANTTLPVSGISVADVDAGTLQVTLTVTSGTLTLATTPGLTVTDNGTGRVVLLGAPVNLNAGLATLRYNPPIGFGGPVTITVVTSDLGNTGLGGPLTDTDTISVTVLPPPPPVVQFQQARYEVRENGSGTLTLIVTRDQVAAFSVQYEVVVVQHATPDKDFILANGTFHFGVGELSKTIPVGIMNDKNAEGKEETFRVTLTNPEGATLGTPSSTLVVIGDDDTAQVADSPAPPSLPVVAIGFAKSREHYEDFVRKAYLKYLGREAEAAGLDGWATQLQQGLRPEEFEVGFIASVEYVFVKCQGDHRCWVIGLYKDLLNRDPSQAELDAWLDVLRRGGSPIDIARGIAGSLERVIIRIGDNYRDYLGREPSQVEVDAWVELFRRGFTPEDMVAGFVGSLEYYQNPNKGGNNCAYWLVSAYRDVLFREPGREEVVAWLPILCPENEPRNEVGILPV